MRVIIIAAILALAGCASTVTPTVITETKYVVRQPSEELMTLPDRNPYPETVVKTDDEAAKWIIQTETYVELLEEKFGKLVEFIRSPKQD